MHPETFKELCFTIIKDHIKLTNWLSLVNYAHLNSEQEHDIIIDDINFKEHQNSSMQ